MHHDASEETSSMFHRVDSGSQILPGTSNVNSEDCSNANSYGVLFLPFLPLDLCRRDSLELEVERCSF